jgi:hypothetical protein
MSLSGNEPKQVSDTKKVKRPSSCKIPYSDWILWDPLQRQSQIWSRLGIVPTLTIALGLLWIVWSIWPTAEWVKPATSETQIQEDRSTCREVAFKKDSLIGISRGFKYSSAYKSCMESKGYSLTEPNK